MGLVDRIKRMRPKPTGAAGQALPDPAKPPGNRGSVEQPAEDFDDLRPHFKRLPTDARPDGSQQVTSDK